MLLIADCMDVIAYGRDRSLLLNCSPGYVVSSQIAELKVSSYRACATGAIAIVQVQLLTQ